MTKQSDLFSSVYSEDRIQQEIFIHINNTYCRIGLSDRGIIFHVPNQRISKLERIKLAAIGVLSGVSDLVFIYKGKHLYLEIKTTTGTQSPDQKDFQSRIEANGFKYYLLRSLADALDVIKIEFGE